MTAPDAAEMTLQSLLERVERASGPDRKLDGDLYNAFCSHATQEFTEWDSRHDFTYSLDTALALVDHVLPGWHVTIQRDEATHRRPHCAHLSAPLRLRNTPGWWWPEGYGDGASLQLALLAAMLRVLIAKEQEHGR